MRNEEDSIEIGYNKNEGKTKKQLIMEAWNRCNESGAKEMKRGYYNTKFDKMGNPHKVWVEDTRETYINSVTTFDDNMADNYDDKYKKKKEEIGEKLKKIFNKYGWKEFKIKKESIKDVYNGFIYAKEYTGIIIMPEPSDGGIFVNDMNSDGRQIKVDWSNSYHQYMQELILIYRELFRELIKLYGREEGLVEDKGLTEETAEEVEE